MSNSMLYITNSDSYPPAAEVTDDDDEAADD